MCMHLCCLRFNFVGCLVGCYQTLIWSNLMALLCPQHSTWGISRWFTQSETGVHFCKQFDKFSCYSRATGNLRGHSRVWLINWHNIKDAAFWGAFVRQWLPKLQSGSEIVEKNCCSLLDISVCLCMYVCTCTSVCMSTCMTACMYVCMYVWLMVWLSVCPDLSCWLSFCLSVCVIVCVSVYVDKQPRWALHLNSGLERHPRTGRANQMFMVNFIRPQYFTL